MTNMKLNMAAMMAVLLLVVYAEATQTQVKMDKTNDSCGKVIVLGPSHEARLTSSGLAPDGYCGVSIFTPTEVDNYTCDALCVTFKTASISSCDVKIKFVGHMFRKSGDIDKEFNCHYQDMTSFCWEVSSMRVEVIESYIYAYVDKRALYEFDIDVSPRCSKTSVKKHAGYFSTREQMEEQEYQTYVEGIAVGVSLACVFLIILFVMWCYTKHQAVVSSPADSSRRKSSIFAFGRKPSKMSEKTSENV